MHGTSWRKNLQSLNWNSCRGERAQSVSTTTSGSSGSGSEVDPRSPRYHHSPASSIASTAISEIMSGDKMSDDLTPTASFTNVDNPTSGERFCGLTVTPAILYSYLNSSASPFSYEESVRLVDHLFDHSILSYDRNSGKSRLSTEYQRLAGLKSSALRDEALEQSAEFAASVCKSAHEQLRYRNDRDVIIADLQAESKNMNRKLDQLLEAHRVQLAEKDALLSSKDAQAEARQKKWQVDFESAVEEKVKPLRTSLCEQALALSKKKKAFEKEKGVFNRDRTEIQAFKKAAGGGENTLTAHYKHTMDDMTPDRVSLKKQFDLAQKIMAATEEEMSLARQQILLQGDMIDDYQKELNELTKTMAQERKAFEKKISSAKTKEESNAQELLRQKTLANHFQSTSEKSALAISALVKQVAALSRLTTEQGKKHEARVAELEAELKSEMHLAKSELGIVQTRMDASETDHELTREVLVGVRHFQLVLGYAH